MIYTVSCYVYIYIYFQSNHRYIPRAQPQSHQDYKFFVSKYPSSNQLEQKMFQHGNINQPNLCSVEESRLPLNVPPVPPPPPRRSNDTWIQSLVCNLPTTEERSIGFPPFFFFFFFFKRTNNLPYLSLFIQIERRIEGRDLEEGGDLS